MVFSNCHQGQDPLTRLWEQKVEWDSPIPQSIFNVWIQWRSELPLLSDVQIPRCFFLQGVEITSIQIHGFCDAFESAYGGVVYFRMIDSFNHVHTSLLFPKKRWLPSRSRLSCGWNCVVLTYLLTHHVKEVFQFSYQSVFAWSDSTTVLSWLVDNTRHFKTYVASRVSFIVEHIPPD
jgi:hypothetical protein